MCNHLIMYDHEGDYSICIDCHKTWDGEVNAVELAEIAMEFYDER